MLQYIPGKKNEAGASTNHHLSLLAWKTPTPSVSVIMDGNCINFFHKIFTNTLTKLVCRRRRGNLAVPKCLKKTRKQ